jgi:uncharacterized membrane protein
LKNQTIYIQKKKTKQNREIMDPFSYETISIASLIAISLAIRSVQKHTLTIYGASIGCIIGFILVSTGLRGMVLFIFYQFGSWATKYKHNIKSNYDQSQSISTCRGPYQVLCVSIIATVLSLYHAIVFGPEQPFHYTTTTTTSASVSSLSWLLGPFSSSSFSSSVVSSPTTLSCAVLAHHATGLADTLASEMGMVLGSIRNNNNNNTIKDKSSSSVVLITKPWKHVPAGTNGGVTIQGFIWSCIGGTIIGIVTIMMDYLSGIQPLYPERVIVFATICGLLGSIIDSVLGATIQATYYNTNTKQICSKQQHHQKQQRNNNTITSKSINSNNYSIQHISGIDLLSNEQVNFVSMLLTSIIGGWIIGPLIFT